MQHKTHLWRRGAVAVGLVMGFVALMSSPASAGLVNMTVTSGTVNIGTETFNVGGGGPDKCTTPIGAQTVPVNWTGNANSGTWSVPVPAPPAPPPSIKSRFRLAAPNDAQYWQADMAFLSASGTYTNTPTIPPQWAVPAGKTHIVTSSANNHITIEAKIYRLTPPTCAKDDLACTVRARIVLTSPSALNSANMPNPIAGDAASLVGTSNTTGGVPVTVVGGACPATITSQLVNKHVSIPAAGPLVLTV